MLADFFACDLIIIWTGAESVDRGENKPMSGAADRLNIPTFMPWVIVKAAVTEMHRICSF